MTPLTNSKECEAYLRNIWAYDTMPYEESVYIVFLNKDGVRMEFKMITQGRYSECNIDPKCLLKIVQKAAKIKSKYLVLAHNHPCGSLEPSEGDIASTHKFALALSFHAIDLVDHIIITEGGYFSFKDAGLLNERLFKNVG